MMYKINVVCQIQQFFLNRNTIVDVPTKVADQQSHRLPNTPDSKAGANERAGFIDAPEIKAKKKISNPTIPPMAIPLNPSILWCTQLQG